MSWAEDYGYDAWDFEDFHHDFKLSWELTWHRLNSKGYVWQDKNGKDYKPEDISDNHLISILNFCKRSWRPKQQIDELKKIAKERGLK